MMHRKVYVADTVALARYFEDSLPPRAEEAFREAESGAAQILVPDIVIGEFVYIALKGRLATRDPKSVIRELLREVGASQYLKPASMSMDAWEAFLGSDVSELHDRIIQAIALANSASGIITPDKELSHSSTLTVW
jgi:predicted nucleic acid-binding protein